jgi:hypothetical protein
MFLSVYDDAPGLPGLPLVPAFPMPGPFIEGNDLEWNPTLTLGYIPTLPAMVQVDPIGLGLLGTYPLTGFGHVRNQDAVFTPTGVPIPKWVYAMQGAMVIGDDLAFGPLPAFLPSPGVTYDGVDPAFGDTPPFGEIVSIATSAATNVYHAPALVLLFSIPRTPGAGPLRTDVDHKPAPMFGNFIVQPAIGGILSIGGFGPSDWLVTVANGVEIVDLGAGLVMGFLPYAATPSPRSSRPPGPSPPSRSTSPTRISSPSAGSTSTRPIAGPTGCRNRCRSSTRIICPTASSARRPSWATTCSTATRCS